MTTAAPIPQGDYASTARHGNLLLTAGITPRRDAILLYPGRLEAGKPHELYRAAVELAARNVLAALDSALAPSEKIGAILHATIYLAATPDFTAHSAVADFASRVFQERLGDAGRCARAAVGVASLPGGAFVEICVQALAEPAI